MMFHNEHAKWTLHGEEPDQFFPQHHSAGGHSEQRGGAWLQVATTEMEIPGKLEILVYLVAHPS